MWNTGFVVADRILPDVPLRQWVLSTPFELRLLLAKNAAAFGALTRVFAEEVLSLARRRAKASGLGGSEGGVSFFGSIGASRAGSTVAACCANLDVNTDVRQALLDAGSPTATVSRGEQLAVLGNFSGWHHLHIGVFDSQKVLGVLLAARVADALRKRA